MCLTFRQSNHLLIQTDEWLVARKHFNIEDGKLISTYNRKPYNTCKLDLNNRTYLHIIKQNQMQPVIYKYSVLDWWGDETITGIKKEYMLGYHAMLFTKEFLEQDASNLCLMEGLTIWLPIVFEKGDIQMISCSNAISDVVVDNFHIPLSLGFYFELAKIINIEERIVIDFWLPRVSNFIELLQLNEK